MLACLFLVQDIDALPAHVAVEDLPGVGEQVVVLFPLLDLLIVLMELLIEVV